MRRFLAKAGEHRPPGCGVLRRQRRDRSRGLLEILADAKIGVVAEDAGETVGGGRESEALRREFVFMGGEEWRPANNERFIAQRSWRKPGKVTSRVLTAPPGSAACSITATDQPRFKRWIAAARPLCPAPTTTASNASISRSSSPPISRQLHISGSRRREATSNAWPAQCLNCAKNDWRPVPDALAPIACIRIFLVYGGRAFARAQSEGTRMREETFEERWR